MTERHAVVTGAFSNIGAAAAQALLDRGWRVSTLTNRRAAPGDDPRITRHPLRFEPRHLETVLANVDAVVNTYWIRFPHNGTTFEDAIDRSTMLVAAARNAGVSRFVHVSVSNPSLDSPLGYYAGKARVEDIVRSAGMSWSIVRPTLVVGPRDVLSNNIAWFVRRFPVIAVPAGPGYRLQPVRIDDLATMLADRVESDVEEIVDAAGPDIFGFDDYVRLLGQANARTPRLVRMPPGLMLAALAIAGLPLRDRILTREELDGLRDELLVSRAPATTTGSVSEWVLEHGSSFGGGYANDTRTRFARA